MSENQLSNIFTVLEDVIAAHPESIPWVPQLGGPPLYRPRFEVLEDVITTPIRERTKSQSGRFAKAVDAWVAYELRCAGFDPDEVWPRPTAPRVVPREVSQFLNALPRDLQKEARERLLSIPAVAPADAHVLGRAYRKQVDVLIAQWSRGPELLVSTKTMSSSFGKNMFNRFEEAYGDAKNLRGRYPLVSMGFLFLVRSTIFEHRSVFERAVDMMRKLKAERDVYDATCLLVLDWNDEEPFNAGVVRDEEIVPADLGASTFMTTMIDAVLERTPVDMHVEVRQRRENRTVPVAEVTPDTPEPSEDPALQD